MRKLILPLLIIVAVNANAQSFDWVKVFGSSSADISYHNKTDNDGNIYVAGSFTDTMYFDESGIAPLISRGKDDAFVIKFDSAGLIQWTLSFGGTEIDKAVAVAVDQDNDIYITGDFQSENVDFDPEGSSRFSSKGNEDGFLLKLNSNGQFLWVNVFGEAAKDAGISIDIDPANNVILTGFFANTVDFDPGEDIVNLRSAGSIDGFVLKMDKDKNFIWARAFNGTDWVKGLFVVSDQSSNYYITGYFRATADFNPNQVETYNLTAAGLRDFYIVKLNENGDFEWAGGIGSVEEDRAISLALDGSANLYIAGYFGDVADFDIGVSDRRLTSNGDSDAFLLKMTTDGNFLWVKQFGGPGKDKASELKLDPTGNVYLLGDFQNSVDFDPGIDIQEYSSKGNSDVFLLKTDTDGNYLWNITFGGGAPDEAYALSRDRDNNLFISGTFFANVDFDFEEGTHFEGFQWS